MEEILINIDSKYRDLNIYPLDSKFRINLGYNYKNIISAKLVSVEVNNNVQLLNYKNINSIKNNNYFTLHIPNKINDIEGTKIIVSDGLTRTIDILKTNINNQLTIFNNNFTKNEKYFYLFYLMDYQPDLKLNVGWYSVYGLYNIIINSESNLLIVNTQPITLNVYDTRFINNKRTDTIDLRGKPINSLKTELYKIYVNDPNFIPSPTGTGILDILVKNFTIIYSINTSAGTSNPKNFNLTFNFNSSSLITTFSNLLGNVYSQSNNGTISPIWTQIIPTINDIIPFEIDFYNYSIQSNSNLNYPSIGYMLGYRPILQNFLLNSNYSQLNSDTELSSNYPYNLNDNLYLFLKINDWGCIQFNNNKFFAKILFTSYSTCNKIDDYVNPEFKFRQPINFDKLDIELLDYLGNTLELNGRDFSFTISLKEIFNIDDKYQKEANNLVFKIC